MSGSGSFRPDSESSLIITFEKGHADIASVVVFELGDEHLGGVRRPGTNNKEILCSEKNVQRGLCEAAQIGEFLVSDAARRKARHEFITRAVNLSDPVTILYPVSSPGYYCTAAITTGASFSATMLAIEKGRSIPAFKAGLLSVYRSLAPSWMLMAAAWFTWRLSLSEPLRNSTTRWLVPLSALQVLVRLAGLEMGTQGPRVAWALLWYILNVAQYTAVVQCTYIIAIRQHPWGYARYLAVVAPSLTLGLQSAANWVDFVAGPASRGALYTNLVGGCFSFTYLVVCVLHLVRWPIPTSSEHYWQSLRSAKLVLAAGLVSLAILFGITAVLSLCEVVKGLPPAEFAHRFLLSRYWLFDAPRDWIFLFWTAFLALYCEYADIHSLEQRHHQVAGVEEMEYLQKSEDTTGA